MAETCDGIRDGLTTPCKGELRSCGCARCRREPPEERFYTCDDEEHQDAAGARHLQIRGTMFL